MPVIRTFVFSAIKKHVTPEKEADEMQTDLAASGIVVFVGHGALGQFLPVTEVGVRECPTKFCCERNVVVASSPPEVAVWLVTWHRSAATPDGGAGTTRLGDGVSQRRCRQSVDERLLATPCNITNKHLLRQAHVCHRNCTSSNKQTKSLFQTVCLHIF